MGAVSFAFRVHVTSENWKYATTNYRYHVRGNSTHVNGGSFVSGTH
jgi:hypothetical protein